MAHFNRAIYMFIKKLIEKNETFEQIKANNYLLRHLEPFEIEEFYNLTLERLKRKENAKTYRLTIRLSKKQLELLGNKDKSTKIRRIFEEYVARGGKIEG